jgi:glycosyltransferase involved in cell wall biosynthesis
VGVNSCIVEQGMTGFLASGTAEWQQALARLSQDSNLRCALGKAGRSKVEQEYSLQAAAPRLYKILIAAASSGKTIPGD